ncbi:hypothetical protein [Paraclostridium bifermentans]
MKLKDFKNLIQIKWNCFDIVVVPGSWDLSTKFDVDSNEFLDFAKSDYNNRDKKGLIGALSNSKRAIDCQVDWIISYLGYDYLNFNDKKYPQIKKLIDEFELGLNTPRDSHIKLRFIQAIGLAPISLISEIRTIRNKLEHEYILPDDSDVRSAIELAELFINSTQGIITNKFSNDCYLGNYYNEEIGTWETPYLEVSFEIFKREKNYISIIFNEENEDLKEIRIKKFIELKSTDDGYAYFIKSLMTQDFSYLIRAFGDSIDKKYVNYKFKQY